MLDESLEPLCGVRRLAPSSPASWSFSHGDYATARAYPRLATRGSRPRPVDDTA
jgi:hypothetical protein